MCAVCPRMQARHMYARTHTLSLNGNTVTGDRAAPLGNGGVRLLLYIYVCRSESVWGGRHSTLRWLSFPACVATGLALAGCRYINYHPYDVDVDGEKMVNVTNAITL